MNLFGWLRRRPARLMPEALWVVELEGGQLSVVEPKSDRSIVHLRELSRVTIETNDSGPVGQDVWWLFETESGDRNAFPQGATGEQAVIDYVMALPSVDHEAMIRAMSSTDNARFLLWERGGGEVLRAQE